MRRVCALFVVLLAWGMLAASAGASVESKRVKQSRDDVVSYWTPERMRNAKPAEHQLAGKPGGGGGKPTAGAATEVAGPYTSNPTSTNGKVFFTENGVNYVCSGTAVDSTNGGTVWTAGHCVNEGPGDFVTNWAFVPAYRDGVRPYGTFAAATLKTTSQWAGSGDFRYDFGAAAVSPAGGKSLTASIGAGRGMAFNYNRSGQTYSAFGYPAANPFNGQRLWVCGDAPLYMNDSGNMGIQCNLTGGSSGGGWISGGLVYSVNSYGYNSLKNVMFGPYQGSDAQALYNSARTWTP